MNLSIQSWIIVCTTLYVFIEFAYSVIKRDTIYRTPNTLSNIFCGIIIKALSLKTYPIYSLVFIYLFTNIGYSYRPFTTVDFVSALILNDFIQYLLHYAKHRVSALWALHYVHHSDRTFNMSVYWRASWLEQFGLSGIPILVGVLLGYNPTLLSLVSFIPFVYQFYCHSAYIKLPHFISYVLVTPQYHQLHHDMNEQNQNGNFGILFTIWDKIFRTERDLAELKKFKSGIRNYNELNPIKIQIDPLIQYITK